MTLSISVPITPVEASATLEEDEEERGEEITEELLLIFSL
jgi:hypothetical protein